MGSVDKNTVEEIFVGRQVVEVDGDTLVLDDGKVLTVVPNQGCWSCSSGNFSLDKLNHVESVITGVKLDDKVVGDSEHVYTLFVYTGGKKNKKGKKNVLLEISGDDGNGFYGTGYEIKVM